MATEPADIRADMDRAEPMFAALAAEASRYRLKKKAREKSGRAVREVRVGKMPLRVPMARLVLTHSMSRKCAS